MYKLYIPVKSYQLVPPKFILATPAENATRNNNHLTSQKATDLYGTNACGRTLRFFVETLNFLKGNGAIKMHNNPTSNKISSLNKIHFYIITELY